MVHDDSLLFSRLYLGAQSIPVTLRSCWSRTASCLPPSRAYSTTYAQVLLVCCKVLQSVTHCHTVLRSGAKCLHVLLDHLHLPIAVGESHNLPVCVPGVALHRTWAQLLYCGGHQVVLKLFQSCHCTSPGSDSVEVITKQLD